MAIKFCVNLDKSTLETLPMMKTVFGASPHFFLIPRLKTPMKGHHFGTVDEVKDACTEALKDIREKAYCEASDASKSH